MDRNQEIEYFKTNIDLVLFIQSYGYEKDFNKSSRHNTVMKKNGENLIISLNRSSNHWQYFNGNDDTDRGTIIEFIQKRKSINLGLVRKDLREFLNMSDPIQNRIYEPKKSLDKINIKKVQAFIKHRKTCISNQYLRSRGITSKTLRTDIFHGRVLDGYKGAVIFPHFNSDGISSYEVNNEDFKHFPEEGIKGLWVTRTPAIINEIIFIESPIEGLSYYQFYKYPENVLLVSGSGNWSKEADNLIINLINKNPASKIKAAFNNDKGGLQQYERLKNLLIDKSEIIKFFPEEEGGDWNKKLRLKRYE